MSPELGTENHLNPGEREGSSYFSKKVPAGLWEAGKAQTAKLGALNFLPCKWHVQQHAQNLCISRGPFWVHGEVLV